MQEFPRFGARQVSTISRRSFLRRAGIAGLALGSTGTLGSLAAACGESAQSPEGADPAPKGTKVSGKLSIGFAVLRGESIAEAWQIIFDRYREIYPNVQLKASGIPADNWSEFFDKIATQIAGGEAPDVVQVATEGQRLFASRGLALPIDEYIERDRDELKPYFENVHANLQEWSDRYSSPDDKTYYLPGEFNTMAIWYNTQLFQEAGVNEPTDDWTWQEFRTAAEQLTGEGVYGMHVPPEYFGSAMPWLLTNDASTLNAEWTQATVDTPNAIESANFMRSMVEDGISPAPGGTFDVFQAIAQGKVAMFGAGRWPLIPMQEANMVDQLKIVEWPQNEKKGSPVGWNSYPILAESQNREAAWAMVKFLASEEASVLIARAGTVSPPRESVGRSEAFLSNAPEGSEKFYDALNYATPIPSPDEGSIVEREIVDTFTQILAGNANTEEALKELDKTIQSEL
jgi:multiple sugar transport system substrate-binding protein